MLAVISLPSEMYYWISKFLFTQKWTDCDTSYVPGWIYDHDFCFTFK